MHKLEPWQAETLLTLYAEKQRVIQAGNKRLAQLDNAIRRQIDTLAQLAGLDEPQAAVEQDGVLVLVPLSEIEGDST